MYLQLALLGCASRHLDVHIVSWRIGHALTAWRRQQGARHRQSIIRNRQFGVRPWINRQHFYGVYETLICWAREIVKWRFIVVRLVCVYLRSVCDNFCPRSLAVIVARRPHGGRTFTCHHLPLLCDQTDRRQVFEHVQKPTFERTFTCGYSSDRTNAVRLTYVYLRSLAITCRNHS